MVKNPGTIALAGGLGLPIMSTANLVTLGHLIRDARETLLARWRDRVRQLPSAQQLDIPALNDHVPVLLDEMAELLKQHNGDTIEETLLEGSPPIHGRQRLIDGFDISEVVSEYHELRGCIYELADENGIVIRGRSLQIVNRVIDEAIGLAVQTYATARALEIQQRRAEQLAFVAHDLRTPLSAVRLAAEYLEVSLAENISDSEASEMIQILKRNVQQLADLITRIIKEHSDAQTQLEQKLERRTIDLWPLVQEVVANLAPVSETAGVSLANKVPRHLRVFADAELLARVFQNLLSNAFKYSPRSDVTIEASQLASGDVECVVRDKGIGMTPEQMERLFDKGSTGGDGTNGFGLGLSIVKELVEAHGGYVKVESADGAGTTVRFTLPAKDHSMRRKGS
jgi:two-component system, OmpR family, phosphate regulon sensor histidine kinase PhoR